MAARTWTLALLLASAAALAGCTNNEAPQPSPAPDANEPPAPEPAAPPAEPPAPQPPARPTDFTLTDAGEIRGSFEQTWDIQVANVAFREAGLHFALQGLQSGAPPTARVHLALHDPQGNLVQSGMVGLGAPSNELTWAFTPGQLPLPGTYQLKATSADDTPLPSGGFAAWTLDAHVTY